MDTLCNRRRKKRKKEIRKKELSERLIKGRIIRDIRTLFEKEEGEDCYKPKRVSKFPNNNYIEYESNGDKNRNLSLDECFNNINSYFRNIMIDLQNYDTWKIQLTIANNFTSSEDVEEEFLMHSSNHNIKLTPYNDVNEVINELFASLLSRYQENLEKSMRGSNFIFDSVQRLYCKCHKVNFKRGDSHIDSPDWIKKATLNLKNTGNKCFQYTATVALNYEEIESHPERISNIKLFISKYNW